MRSDTLPWNSYPALLSAGCFSCGIMLADVFAPPMLMWMALMGATAVLALGIPVRSLVSFQDIRLTVCAMIMLVGAGAIRYTTYYSVPADHIGFVFKIDGRALTFSGTVAEAPGISDYSVRLTLEVDSGGYASDLHPQSGKLRVAVSTSGGLSSSFSGLRACDRIRVEGELERLPQVRNPGEFDYARYLRRRQIYALLKASSRDIVVLGPRASTPACGAGDLRMAIRASLEPHVRDERARAVIGALVLGDRRGIDDATLRQFTRTGILHLLAVSGLHVMIVGMILYRLLRPTLMRLGLKWQAVEVIRSTLTALVLLTYMLVTGASPSVVRAVLMTILFTSASTLQRTAHPLNTLGAAGLLILAITPSHLFEPGFQLSVAAVGAIVSLTPGLPAAGPARYLASSMAVTIAATAGTLPVVIHHFGHVSLGGLFLNIVAVPVTSAALSSGIATVAVGPFWTTGAGLLGVSTEFLIRLLLLVADHGDRLLGWSYLRWNSGHSAMTVSLTLLIFSGAVWNRARARWRLIILSFLLVTSLLWIRIAGGYWRPQVDVLFLDVGQGDAILVLLPDRTAVLIDAGMRSPFTDAGQRVIVPLLERMGVERIHTAVVTHSDSDHLGGLPAVLRGVPVGRVLHNGIPHSSSLYRETNSLLDSLNISSRSLRAGDTLSVDGMLRIFVMHPHEPNSNRRSNDNSIALQLHYGTTSFLLMGDAPAGAELEMVRRFRPILSADVLKVGHHGSKTSSAPGFISYLSARATRTAVISVARVNRYGLPDESVLRRLHAAGLETHSTAHDGAVWLRSDGSRIQRVHWRR